MASLTILYWRDIPSQVIVKSGRSSAKRQLSERFIRAIDAAAMHAGAKSDDAYLAEWRRGEPIPCGDDLESEAAAAAERLEREYDTHRLAFSPSTTGAKAECDARQVARRRGLRQEAKHSSAPSTGLRPVPLPAARRRGRIASLQGSWRAILPALRGGGPRDSAVEGVAPAKDRL